MECLLWIEEACKDYSDSDNLVKVWRIRGGFLGKLLVCVGNVFVSGGNVSSD